LAKAAVIKASGDPTPVVFLTTDLPAPGTPGEQALRTAHGGSERVFFDALEMLDPDHCARLEGYARGHHREGGDPPALLPSSSPGE
jgi:hypothetical protein